MTLLLMIAQMILPLNLGDSGIESIRGVKLNCSVSLRGYSSGVTYDVGFNYELLNQFAYDQGCEVEISIDKFSNQKIAEIENGELDILIAPFSEEFEDNDNISYIFMSADSTCWITSAEDSRIGEVASAWFIIMEESGRYDETRCRFTPPFRHHKKTMKGKSVFAYSPYDEIIQKYAKEIGWDWKLLLAAIWQESHFKIEAQSRRGAVGLFQLMPATFATYESGSYYDPEKNISAGTKHLKRIKRIFSEYASGDELAKITLAAFNAGEGRILDCIAKCKEMKKPYSTWDDIVAIIPYVENFNGSETVSHVKKITELYGMFKPIGSSQSSKDRPSQQKDTAASEEALSLQKLSDQQEEE